MLFVSNNLTEKLDISIVKQIGCSGVINIKESQSLTFSNESFYSIGITGLCEINPSRRSVHQFADGGGMTHVAKGSSHH